MSFNRDLPFAYLEAQTAFDDMVMDGASATGYEITEVAIRMRGVEAGALCEWVSSWRPGKGTTTLCTSRTWPRQDLRP